MAHKLKRYSQLCLIERIKRRMADPRRIFDHEITGTWVRSGTLAVQTTTLGLFSTNWMPAMYIRRTVPATRTSKCTTSRIKTHHLRLALSRSRTLALPQTNRRNPTNATFTATATRTETAPVIIPKTCCCCYCSHVSSTQLLHRFDSHQGNLLLP